MDVNDPLLAPARRAVATLIAALPELAPLVEQWSEELGAASAPIVFCELADYTGRLLRGPTDDADEAGLEAIFAAIEQVAARTDVDSVAHVGHAFLDGLDPGALARAQAYLGPATEELLELLLEQAGEDHRLDGAG
jgi:hypothetical protein